MGPRIAAFNDAQQHQRGEEVGERAAWKVEQEEQGRQRNLLDEFLLVRLGLSR